MTETITIRSGDFECVLDLRGQAGLVIRPSGTQEPNTPMSVTNWGKLMKLMFRAADENKETIEALRPALAVMKKEAYAKWDEDSRFFQDEWKNPKWRKNAAEANAIRLNNARLTDRVKASKATYERIKKMIKHYDTAQEWAKEKGRI